ncbi:Peptidoglycan endopeptidase RipA precursor (plasmid) [Streptomyces sp. YIM 121038]|uniref:C40 family peptidase n=1 Tax=Streptomyces sp. YIM 121038 TaxID=2136401 RepID=UPI0011102D54|nr:bifunctional lytic transglycosylase/C40 family peptidase [Streptomyces sp. YIM 121038]QCX82268.1 Peptidoglycan endopeptidase RipA precursor [Streptomyces sp. YIM 121038]
MRSRRPAQPGRRRHAKWGCLVALLAVIAGCTAPLAGIVSAGSLLTNADDGGESDDGWAESGSAADIPAAMLAAYKKASRLVGRHVPACRGMSWPVLAGIAKVESDHASGRTIASNGDIRPRILGVLLDGSGAGGNTTVFPDTDNGRWEGTARGERAVGPFQFLPSTWASTGRDGNGDNKRDPHNAFDAALGAAVYLCGRGRDLTKPSQLRAAIFQYNRSSTYVANVSGWISQYRAAARSAPGSTGLPTVSGRVRKVLAAALSQRGAPYSWGGGGTSGRSYGHCCSPTGKSGTRIWGYDCSGLTMYAFARVGIKLPRTAAAQARRGVRIPASRGPGALRPGDLVFFGYTPGRDATIYHVGIYAGTGQMINAARPGTVVRLDPVNAMPGFAGGARLL